MENSQDGGVWIRCHVAAPHSSLVGSWGGLDQGPPVLVASQSDACRLGGVTSSLQGAG